MIIVILYNTIIFLLLGHIFNFAQGMNLRHGPDYYL